MLRAHREDRGLDFEAVSLAVPLIDPLVIAPTSRAQREHRECEDQEGQGAPVGTAGI